MHNYSSYYDCSQFLYLLNKSTNERFSLGLETSRVRTRPNSFLASFGLGLARVRFKLTELAQSHVRDQVCICFLGLVFRLVRAKLVLSLNKLALNLVLFFGRVENDVVC